MSARTLKYNGHTFRTASQRRFVLFGIYQGEPVIIRRSDDASKLKRLAQATDFVVDFVGGKVYRPAVQRFDPQRGWTRIEGRWEDAE